MQIRKVLTGQTDEITVGDHKYKVRNINDLPLENKNRIMNFHISGGLLQLLKEIETEHQLEPTKSIPRAISLLYIAKREQKKGNKLAVIDDSGNLVSEIYNF
jgi:hypothetical protein